MPLDLSGMANADISSFLIEGADRRPILSVDDDMTCDSPINIPDVGEIPIL